MAQGGGGFDPLPDAWSEGLFRRDDSAMEKAPSTGIANKSHSIDRRTDGTVPVLSIPAPFLR